MAATMRASPTAQVQPAVRPVSFCSTSIFLNASGRAAIMACFSASVKLTGSPAMRTELNRGTCSGPCSPITVASTAPTGTPLAAATNSRKRNESFRE